MPTTFRDDRLAYEHATTADLDDFAAMLGRPAVCEHVFFGPNPPEVTDAFFRPLLEAQERCLAAGETPASHVFVLRDVETGGFVGQCAAVAAPFGERHFQIGYQLDEPWWRRGLGTRAAEFLLHLGFTLRDADRLSAECLASNAGSIAILQRLGFTREGLRRRQYHARGAHHDEVLWGLLREDVTCDLEALAQRFA